MVLTASFLVVGACVGTSEDSTLADHSSPVEVTYSTYVEGANVWVVSDCPNTDQTLKGNPDGLPHMSSTTDRDAIEAWFGSPENSRIIPRNGEVWERVADGSIEITEVADWMIEVTVDDVRDCPGAPTSTNGVPLIYRFANG